MQRERRPDEPDGREGVKNEEQCVQLEKEEGGEHNDEQAVVPAKLPPYSKAAAAQRLNEIPPQAPRGVHYSAPHLRTHPEGWRAKRHKKRKNLRISNSRHASAENLGMRLGFMPLTLITLTVLVVGTSVLVGLAAFRDATYHRYGQALTTLPDILPKDNLKLYDAQGELLYQSTSRGIQTTVPFSKISKHLVNAEVAIEDQSFWNNEGYDITGIVRAALENLLHGRVMGGGSTITQQLIKNAIVGNQTSMIRKLQEILLAPDVTRRFSKEEILSMYLNTIYYGEQAYGAEAAAFTYFGLQPKDGKTAAEQLDIAQAAMLAGIPSSPNARNPFKNFKVAFSRMKEILKQMRLQGYITHDEELQAIHEAQQPDFLKRGVIKNDALVASHFINYTLRELADELHVKVEDLPRSGLIVKTTLDYSKQKEILKIAQKHIRGMAAQHNMSNAAVVVLDPHTGAIRALLGNIDPADPQSGAFDVASQGLRQPGSTFKAFIYANAFNQGISPGNKVADTPLTVQMCCGLPPYQPKNYDLKFHGIVSYRYALQNSFNIPAVRLLMQTGVDESLNLAKKMGITEYNGTPNYTMVLGTLGVHLIDMTSAYGVFANKGVRVPPHAIDVALDARSGKPVLQYNKKGEQVISPQLAFVMTDVLSDNTSRIFEFGKCSALYLYSTSERECYAGNPGPVRPSAAKTGTSNDFRDNWTIGYTTDYVVGVWAGNNDNSPMVDVSGIDGAGPIWHDTMQLMEQGKPIRHFDGPPPGVEKRNVDGNVDWVITKH